MQHFILLAGLICTYPTELQYDFFVCFVFASLLWLKCWWPVSWMNSIKLWLISSGVRNCLFLLFAGLLSSWEFLVSCRYWLWFTGWIFDQFQLKWKKVINLMYLSFSVQVGIYVFQLMDHYTAIVSIMFLAFFEVIAICWSYGEKRGVQLCVFSDVNVVDSWKTENLVVIYSAPWRLKVRWRLVVQNVLLFFYIFKQVPIYFGCFREYWNAVLRWNTRIILVNFQIL